MLRDSRSSKTVGRPLEVLAAATRLGLTSFGGPVAHLGYFRDEYIDHLAQGFLAPLRDADLALAAHLEILVEKDKDFKMLRELEFRFAQRIQNPLRQVFDVLWITAESALSALSGS